jgi:hypothetical protein
MSDLLTPTNVIIGLGLYLFLCGLVGCYVSWSRGRPQIEGCVFGALFGPLGLILAACMPADRPADGGRIEDEEDTAARRAIAGLTAPAPAPDRPQVLLRGRGRRRLLGEVEE